MSHRAESQHPYFWTWNITCCRCLATFSVTAAAAMPALTQQKSWECRKTAKEHGRILDSIPPLKNQFHCQMLVLCVVGLVWGNLRTSNDMITQSTWIVDNSWSFTTLLLLNVLVCKPLLCKSCGAFWSISTGSYRLLGPLGLERWQGEHRMPSLEFPKRNGCNDEISAKFAWKCIN